MKKIGWMMSIVLIISGCTTADQGSMTCNAQTQANGVTSSITMKLAYTDGVLTNQIGDISFVMDTSDEYDNMLKQVEQVASIYTSIAGASYAYTKEDDKLLITAHSEIDVLAVDKAQLSLVLNYGEGETLYIDNIEKALIGQGYTCSSD